MKFQLTLLLIISIGYVNAQSISGSLRDESSEPVPFAAITLNNVRDSTLVKSTISNEDGKFNLVSIPVGRFSLHISTLGYEDVTLMVQMEKEPMELGTIVLKESVEVLNEVTVTTEKPMIQVLADKTVFNVENTVNAVGSSALELLRKAPGVILDNGGGIILEGKSGVQIFINGKLSVLQGEDLYSFLESLQASDIEAIEIITQPSSKYDAAGNAGIINIQLKKDKSLGTNGSLTTGITIGNYKRYNNSVNFNSRSAKGNLYGNYSNRFGKSANFLNLLRTQAGTQFDARTRSIYDQNSNNLKLGYDRYLGERHTLGAVLNGNFNNGYGINNSRTPIYPVQSQVFDSVLVANNRTSNKSYNLNGNLNYQYKDSTGRKLNLDLDYGLYNSDREAYQPNVYLDGEEVNIISENITRQVTPVDIDILTAKVDYEQKLLGGALGMGFKLSSVATDNTFNFYQVADGTDILDGERSNTFGYDEHINAVYVNYNYKKGKWNIQGGLRMENTVSEGKLTSLVEMDNAQVKRNYTNWFPSGGLTYQVNPKNQLALTYSKRIQRPNYVTLNPFEYRIDDLSSRQGNPFLQPRYTDNLKLSHTFNYRLTTSISYSFVSDFFAQVTVADGPDRNFITTRNVADQETWNLGISYPGKIKEWWNFYVSVNAFINDYRPTSLEFLAVKQETLSLYAQHTFSLSDSFRVELSGWYSSPSVWGGTYQTQSLGSLNLALQKKMLDDRLTARLSFNDLLYTIPWRGTTQFGDLFIDGSGGGDTKQVAFGLIYDFGRSEIKKARKRNTGLEEEQDRIEN